MTRTESIEEAGRASRRTRTCLLEQRRLSVSPTLYLDPRQPTTHNPQLYVIHDRKMEVIKTSHDAS
jgi:hypothetical protein